jgi:Skp family chaperone for outer membrane proteins
MDRNLMYAGTSVVLAALLGFSWGRGGGGVHAQDVKLDPREVALVDLARVLQAHKGLRLKNEEIVQEGQRRTEELKSIYEAAQQVKKELDAAKKGSAEFKRLEDEFKSKYQEMTKKNQEAQAWQMETNATNVIWAYHQVNEEITRIAESRGFKLVMNFTGEPVTADQKDPQKRQMIINRQILYQSGLDITDEVISAFN